MKAKLKLFEILNLEVELNGFVNLETGERLVEGLLQQKINFGLKYKLKNDTLKIVEEKKQILKFQDELVSKYGTTDEQGRLGIDRWIDSENKIPNPKFVEFNQEWNQFVTSNEKEVELTELSLIDLQEVVTKDNYNTISTYFIKTNE